MIDPSVIEILQTENGYPSDDFVGASNQNLVLLLGDISNSVDYFSLENFLLVLKNPPEMLKVRFMFYKKKYSVAMQFKRPEQVDSFYLGKELLWCMLQSIGQFPEDLRQYIHC